MARPRCPECRAPVEPGDERCPDCGASLAEERIADAPAPRRDRDRREDEDEPRVRRWRGDVDDVVERPRRRRDVRADTTDATEVIVPTNVSGYAILSCYLGLIGMCLPLVGIPFCLISLVCGIIALRRWKSGKSYGEVTSNVRAILGVVFSCIGLFGWGILFVILALTK